MALVLEPSNELILHFVDYNGKHATSLYWLDETETDPAVGGALAIANAAQGISNAYLSVVEILRRARESAPGSATAGPYDRFSDKLKFFFVAEDGSPVIIEIGSPKETVLNTDHKTANRSNSAVSGFLTALQDNAVSAEGKAITYLQSANRIRPSGRKKQ